MTNPDDFDDDSTALSARHEPEAQSVAFTLTVVDGADRGKSITVDDAQPSPALVGSSPACALQLADKRVSRRHASVEIAAGRLRLVDLGSTNGTTVDGVRILDCLLGGGETVRVAETVVRVERAGVRAREAAPSRATSFGGLVGASVEMRRIYPLAERLAASTVPVIIEGDTGTGKEVLAEALHTTGPRAKGPYVVFDCTAVMPNLIESDLFGHERGAFTGATGTRKGVFELADGGTLFIDEIGDLALPLQAKLLRVLERSELKRVGGDKPIRVDVRVVMATRRDLERSVQDGGFRDDLYHRMAVGRVELPPLRRRGGDIALLAKHFWAELGGKKRPLSPSLLARWEGYAWPGNVRELRNAVASELAVGDLYGEATSLGAPRRGDAETARPEAAGLVEETLAMKLPLPVARARVARAFEELYLERVLAEHHGHVARAAEASGVALRYFQLLRQKRRGDGE